MNEEERERKKSGEARQRETQIALQRRAREEGGIFEGRPIETVAKDVGFPDLITPKTANLFWSKFIPLDDCWIWQGFLNASGYGSFNTQDQPRLAHRLSWALAYAPPGEMFVCHKCDTPVCINPSHLFLGTPKDNIQDMMRKGRHNPARGRDNKKSPLFEDQVVTIINSKCSHSMLGRIYRVSPNAIRAIKMRRTWKHIKA